MLMAASRAGRPLPVTSITPLVPSKVSAPPFWYLAPGKPFWAQVVPPLNMPSLPVAVTASRAVPPLPSSSFQRLTRPLFSVEAGAVSGGGGRSGGLVSGGGGAASLPPAPPVLGGEVSGGRLASAPAAPPVLPPPPLVPPSLPGEPPVLPPVPLTPPVLVGDSLPPVPSGGGASASAPSFTIRFPTGPQATVAAARSTSKDGEVSGALRRLMAEILLSTRCKC